jgi:hypothetical protein
MSIITCVLRASATARSLCTMCLYVALTTHSHARCNNCTTTTDTDGLRRSREAVREPDALLPAGSTSDYVAYVPPVDPLAAAHNKSDGTSFGVVRTDALGAKFDLR